ncbi:MAG: carbamoyltransferase HypF [Omnitrophica WOR_2 bacterium RIFCSPHIGHO2_02_FULL_68_15]|nr:MAG: carbamoyltransferase HypF [Omnitrophica WOR_2 bacterium RIFCSPHIGHO2_02_FULL_68_15]
MITAAGRVRLRVAVHGAVQGVGFRPFIYRLAVALGLAGWVRNGPRGVLVEIEGAPAAVESFLARLETEAPPSARLQQIESSWCPPTGGASFEIRPSELGQDLTAWALPDLATCPDCLRELFDPADRRYRYPFTNCTACGPRFSILEGLPYDRAATTMRHFAMCEPCQAEYRRPGSRRFHAEPNACPACGPSLEYWDSRGAVLAAREEALQAAVQALRAGRIIAVKGIGGFHLMVDARAEGAVLELRRRKQREAKPFALLYPSLAAVSDHCRLSDLETRLLQSPEGPIVLLDRLAGSSAIAPSVAPDRPNLGVFLPSNPLHHLLMAALGFPVVATSGNRAEEPIRTDERDALRRLQGLADGFLVHNRPIVRPLEDSVLRVAAGRPLLLRRARGYAPWPVRVALDVPAALAVGGHQKGTIAVTTGRTRDVFVSQHLGDLDTPRALEGFARALDQLRALYAVEPAYVACDGHPDYASTRWAQQSGLPVVRVQHHVAHILACMAEHEIEGPVLGVAWDGAGWGEDGTVWGGEFLEITDEHVRRVAHLRTFPLPGGDAAVREPRRSALGVLYELFGDAHCVEAAPQAWEAFSPQERTVLRAMLQRSLNAPRTSSVGRLIDAVAALAGLCRVNRYEGEAAMRWEHAIAGTATDAHYANLLAPPALPGAPATLEWGPMVVEILQDLGRGVPIGHIAAAFHNTLIEMLMAVARRAGRRQVVLSGGCFQNRYLIERADARLRAEGFWPCWPQRLPPNDGGLALGQMLAVARTVRGQPCA